MKTVAQEMSPHERGLQLKKGLEATGAETVAVVFSQLAQVIGMDEAESMIVAMAQTEELVRNNYSTATQLKADGICVIDRADALEAVTKALIDGNLDKEPAPFDAKAARAMKLARMRESHAGFDRTSFGFGSGSLTRPEASPDGTKPFVIPATNQSGSRDLFQPTNSSSTPGPFVPTKANDAGQPIDGKGNLLDSKGNILPNQVQQAEPFMGEKPVDRGIPAKETPKI